MKKILMMVAGVFLLVAPEAYAQSGNTVGSYVNRGYQIRGVAHTGVRNQHVVYLQSGRTVVSCIVDSRTRRETCRIMSRRGATAPTATTAAGARNTLRAYMRINRCRLYKNPAADARAVGYFRARNYTRRQMNRAIEDLLRTGTLIEENAFYEMVLGCTR